MGVEQQSFFPEMSSEEYEAVFGPANEPTVFRIGMASLVDTLGPRAYDLLRPEPLGDGPQAESEFGIDEFGPLLEALAKTPLGKAYQRWQERLGDRIIYLAKVSESPDGFFGNKKWVNNLGENIEHNFPSASREVMDALNMVNNAAREWFEGRSQIPAFNTYTWIMGGENLSERMTAAGTLMTKLAALSLAAQETYSKEVPDANTAGNIGAVCSQLEGGQYSSAELTARSLNRYSGEKSGNNLAIALATHRLARAIVAQFWVDSMGQEAAAEAFQVGGSLNGHAPIEVFNAVKVDKMIPGMMFPQGIKNFVSEEPSMRKGAIAAARELGLLQPMSEGMGAEGFGHVDAVTDGQLQDAVAKRVEGLEARQGQLEEKAQNLQQQIEALQTQLANVGQEQVAVENKLSNARLALEALRESANPDLEKIQQIGVDQLKAIKEWLRIEEPDTATNERENQEPVENAAFNKAQALVAALESVAQTLGWSDLGGDIDALKYLTNDQAITMWSIISNVCDAKLVEVRNKLGESGKIAQLQGALDAQLRRQGAIEQARGFLQAMQGDETQSSQEGV